MTCTSFLTFISLILSYPFSLALLEYVYILQLSIPTCSACHTCVCDICCPGVCSSYLHISNLLRMSISMVSSRVTHFQSCSRFALVLIRFAPGLLSPCSQSHEFLWPVPAGSSPKPPGSISPSKNPWHGIRINHIDANVMKIEVICSSICASFIKSSTFRSERRKTLELWSRCLSISVLRKFTEFSVTSISLRRKCPCV